MGRIYDALVRFFQEDGWQVEEHADESYLETGYHNDHGPWEFFAQALDDREQCMLLSRWPENVPQERRREMAELLARINYGLVIGNFEMDFADGELRFKTSLDVTDTELTNVLIEQLVRANLATMKKHYPDIRAVIEGGAAADHAQEVDRGS